MDLLVHRETMAAKSEINDAPGFSGNGVCRMMQTALDALEA
jgi:hypothetical protein